MVFRLVVGACLAAVLVASCGGGDTTGDLRTALPFEQVQVNEFTFENDSTFPGRGIFRVVTTEPMICAIVWGQTEELGSFNNSLAMSGTGIVNHDVFLSGAEAGKTYFFRVQGSTADGSFYESPLMTFTLPDDASVDATSDSPSHGVNLALDASVVEVSSEFSSAWSGPNAIDGDNATEWSTSGDGNDAFITIDLGSAQAVAGVEFITRTMADGTATANTFFVSVDGGEALGPFNAGNPADAMFNTVEFIGQVLRFEINTSTGGNTGAIEIRVLAPAP